MTLPTLIHVGKKPNHYDFDEVEGGGHRPSGGLYTSVLDPEYGSCWGHYLVRARYRHHYPFDRPADGWEVRVKEDARWLIVETQEQYDELLHVYPSYYDRDYLNWMGIAKDYDLFYAADYTLPCFDGWDCRTVMVFNWEVIENVVLNRFVTNKVNEIVNQILESYDVAR